MTSSARPTASAAADRSGLAVIGAAPHRATSSHGRHLRDTDDRKDRIDGSLARRLARSRDETLPTGTSATGIAIGAYPGWMTDAAAADAATSLERLQREADEILERPADEGVTLALLVQQHGEMVLERYGVRPANLFEAEPAPITADTPLISWSVAKSIVHAALGILVGDGRIDPLDPAPVPEWRGTEKEAITVLDLLEMRSGLAFVEDYVGETSDVIDMLFGSGGKDHAAYAAAKPLLHPPGSVWS